MAMGKKSIQSDWTEGLDEVDRAIIFRESAIQKIKMSHKKVKSVLKKRTRMQRNVDGEMARLEYLLKQQDTSASSEMVHCPPFFDETTGDIIDEEEILKELLYVPPSFMKFHSQSSDEESEKEAVEEGQPLFKEDQASSIPIENWAQCIDEIIGNVEEEEFNNQQASSRPIDNCPQLFDESMGNDVKVEVEEPIIKEEPDSPNPIDDYLKSFDEAILETTEEKVPKQENNENNLPISNEEYNTQMLEETIKDLEELLSQM